MPFRVELFSEVVWCAGQQTGTHKSKSTSCIPYQLKLLRINLAEQTAITKTYLFKYAENFITKNENFRMKNSDIFHISAQNIDCRYSLEPPRRGGSNEYPQSMLLSRNKKNNVYPCKPQFYYIKWGLRGSKLYRHVFVMKSAKSCLHNKKHSVELRGLYTFGSFSAILYNGDNFCDFQFAFLQTKRLLKRGLI